MTVTRVRTARLSGGGAQSVGVNARTTVVSSVHRADPTLRLIQPAGVPDGIEQGAGPLQEFGRLLRGVPRAGAPCEGPLTASQQASGRRLSQRLGASSPT